MRHGAYTLSRRSSGLTIVVVASGPCCAPVGVLMPGGASGSHALVEMCVGWDAGVAPGRMREAWIALSNALSQLGGQRIAIFVTSSKRRMTIVTRTHARSLVWCPRPLQVHGRQRRPLSLLMLPARSPATTACGRAEMRHSGHPICCARSAATLRSARGPQGSSTSEAGL